MLLLLRRKRRDFKRWLSAIFTWRLGDHTLAICGKYRNPWPNGWKVSVVFSEDDASTHYGNESSMYWLSCDILEYFVWHKQERLTISGSYWKSHRSLVMQCFGFIDNQCGGTADCLKPFLLLLSREAHKRKHLLFSHWDWPAGLEDFLVPPRGWYGLTRRISISRDAWK